MLWFFLMFVEKAIWQIEYAVVRFVGWDLSSWQFDGTLLFDGTLKVISAQFSILCKRASYYLRRIISTKACLFTKSHLHSLHSWASFIQISINKFFELLKSITLFYNTRHLWWGKKHITNEWHFLSWIFELNNSISDAIVIRWIRAAVDATCISHRLQMDKTLSSGKTYFMGSKHPYLTVSMNESYTFIWHFVCVGTKNGNGRSACHST